MIIEHAEHVLEFIIFDKRDLNGLIWYYYNWVTQTSNTIHKMLYDDIVEAYNEDNDEDLYACLVFFRDNWGINS